MPADRERREDRARRQLVRPSPAASRVVRRAVGDAHAELDQRRIVDQPLARSARWTRTRWPVSNTSSSGRTPSCLHPRGHRAQHLRRVGHHVVAAGGEVHRAAVERADLRQQLLDVRQPLGRRRPCRCRRRRAAAATRAPPSTRSPPMPAVRLSTTSTSRGADPLDDLAVERGIARALAGLGVAHVDVRRPPRRPGPPRSPTSAICSGVTGTCPTAADRVARAGDRAGDEHLVDHLTALPAMSASIWRQCRYWTSCPESACTRRVTSAPSTVCHTRPARAGRARHERPSTGRRGESTTARRSGQLARSPGAAQLVGERGRGPLGG